jgi:lambda family phage portal protein
MSLTPVILDSRGNPIPRAAPTAVAERPRHAVRARYDAAELTRDTYRHWIESDGLSAKAANSIMVRYRLRTRARYELANNSYGRGIVETIANDTIGTGPRLQLLGPDPDGNRAIERAFAEWSLEIGLAEKLRTMRKARMEDGEAFGLLTTNPKLNSPVLLDLKVIEADQIATPLYFPFDPLATDGIVFDPYGNPTEYHLLPYHPGDLVHLAPYGKYTPVPADLMIHWFRVDRPGQLRGIPDITPALPLFAQLRRYTLAVIAAAETAADFAAVVYSDAPAGVDQADCEPFEHLDIEKRMMTTLPAGWKMGQFKPEQPTTTYGQFKAEILDEIVRCICMPHNIAAGNSSGYNYSSGRLDHQTYYKALRVDKSQAELIILRPLFRAWLKEASLVEPGLVPPDAARWPRQWFWDGHEHVDPEKEANAQATRLTNRTTTYASEYAKQGQDYEAAFRQIAKEKNLMKDLGISPEEAASGLTPPPKKAPPNNGGGNADTEE